MMHMLPVTTIPCLQSFRSQNQEPQITEVHGTAQRPAQLPDICIITALHGKALLAKPRTFKTPSHLHIHRKPHLNCSSHDARGCFRASTFAQVPSPNQAALTSPQPHHLQHRHSTASRHCHTQDHPLCHCCGQLGPKWAGSVHSSSPRLLAVDSMLRRTLARRGHSHRCTLSPRKPRRPQPREHAPCMVAGPCVLRTAPPRGRTAGAAPQQRSTAHAFYTPPPRRHPTAAHGRHAALPANARIAAPSRRDTRCRPRSGAEPGTIQGGQLGGGGLPERLWGSPPCCRSGLPGWARPRITTSAPTGGSQSRC